MNLLSDRLEKCYSGAVYDVLRAMGHPNQVLPKGLRPLSSGKILVEGQASIDEVGDEIYDLTLRLASGEPSVSELLGHQEYVLTYKTFDPIGPNCLPVVA